MNKIILLISLFISSEFLAQNELESTIMNYFRRIGLEDIWKSTNTLAIEGTLNSESDNGTFTIYKKKGVGSHSVYNFKKGESYEKINKKNVSILNSIESKKYYGDTKSDIYKQKLDELEVVEFADYFNNPKEKGMYRYMGKVRIDDFNCILIEKETKIPNCSIKYYLNADEYTLYQKETCKFGNENTHETIVTKYYEYRDENGLRFPSRIINQYGTLNLEKYILNTKMDDKKFDNQ